MACADGSCGCADCESKVEGGGDSGQTMAGGLFAFQTPGAEDAEQMAHVNGKRCRRPICGADVTFSFLDRINKVIDIAAQIKEEYSSYSMYNALYESVKEGHALDFHYRSIKIREIPCNVPDDLKCDSCEEKGGHCSTFCGQCIDDSTLANIAVGFLACHFGGGFSLQAAIEFSEYYNRGNRSWSNRGAGSSNEDSDRNSIMLGCCIASEVKKRVEEEPNAGIDVRYFDVCGCFDAYIARGQAPEMCHSDCAPCPYCFAELPDFERRGDFIAGVE